MKIRHYAGYGTVSARKISDRNCTLHVQVAGNHECGIERNDLYDLYHWLVKRFDKTVPDATSWLRSHPHVILLSGETTDDSGRSVDTCDYMFYYVKEA